MDVSEAYDHLVQSKYFDPTDSTCSIVLAGWSWRLQTPVVRTIHPPALGAQAGTPWSMTDVVVSEDWRLYSSFFAGNGDRDPVNRAWQELNANPAARFPAYAAFLSRLQDPDETAVGGAPQIALLGPQMRQIIGTHNEAGRRYLLGHFVLSGAEGVSYFDEDLAELT